MKIKVRFLQIFILILFCGLRTNAQTQLDWAGRFGGNEDDFSQSMTVDDSGNVYTTGVFEGTVDFDPGSGVFNLSSENNSQDVFISKLDASGNFIWAKQLGGASTDGGYSIALDASGNIYTTGVFYQTADFDPGPGSFFLTPQHFFDVFVSKLDPSGDFVWAKQFKGMDNQFATSMAIDAFGNVYITGYFKNQIDLNPGPNDFLLSSAGYEDVFVCKLDSAGNFLWGKRLGGNQSDTGASIAVDGSGNVYTTGRFASTANFDSDSGDFFLYSAGGSDVFICKLDVSGNFVMAKQLGGAGDDEAFSLVVDNSGNIYTSGYFEGSADFDPGAGIFSINSLGNFDSFVSKLDSSGNFVWAKGFGGSGVDFNVFGTLDPAGNIYTTGIFEGTVDFDPGSSTLNLTSSGAADFYISKMDTSGNLIWAQSFGGTGSERISSIAVDISGNITATGLFGSTVDFDPGTDTFDLTSAGGDDVFVLKLNENLGVDENYFPQRLFLYPNPINSRFFITNPQKFQIEKVAVYDVLGKKVKAFESNTRIYNISGLQNGLYLVKIYSGNKSLTRRIIKK